MSPTGSSVAFTWPPKGERTPSSRAGGEHRTHGDAAEPEDLVCARPPRGGGDLRAIGELIARHNSLKSFQKGLKRKDDDPMEKLNYQNRMMTIPGKNKRPKSDDRRPNYQKPIRRRKELIRDDSEKESKKRGHLLLATFTRQGVSDIAVREGGQARRATFAEPLGPVVVDDSGGIKVRMRGYMHLYRHKEDMRMCRPMPASLCTLRDDLYTQVRGSDGSYALLLMCQGKCCFARR